MENVTLTPRLTKGIAVDSFGGLVEILAIATDGSQLILRVDKRDALLLAALITMKAGSLYQVPMMEWLNGKDPRD